MKTGHIDSKMLAYKLDQIVYEVEGKDVEIVCDDDKREIESLLRRIAESLTYIKTQPPKFKAGDIVFVTSQLGKGLPNYGEVMYCEPTGKYNGSTNQPIYRYTIKAPFGNKAAFVTIDEEHIVGKVVQPGE